MNRSSTLAIAAFLVFASALCPAFAATVVGFNYLGTDGNNTQTFSSGQFTIANSALSVITLSDLTSFTLQQTVNNGNGAAIGIFNFTKTDLLSFNVSLNNGLVTAAAFETKFNLQTSSPTNDEFKSQNFIALSATAAKTQYRDQLFQIPPPPTNHTSGAISFSTVPEPTCGALILVCSLLLTFRSYRRTK